MTNQRPILLFVTALIGVVLLALSPKMAFAGYDGAPPPEVAAAKTLKIPPIPALVTVRVHEKQPCSMTLRCNSSSCTGAFLSEDHGVFSFSATGNWISVAGMLRSGSDLPPPIGPPRRNS
ncbi:MAG: hypothetical protein K8F25_02220 [Fimbriimonadaceae bacterium]|nr:hypothetical protein [Alphaproteobacteria bacterium]